MLCLVGAWSLDGQPAPPPSDTGLSLIEAVRLALERDPNIELGRNSVESSRGSLLSASGAFDPDLSTSLIRVDSETPESETTSSDSRSLSTEASLSQLLRSGQTLTPRVELERTDADPSVNVATVAFSLRQPLWRGRRRSVVTADEDAASSDLEASRLDLAHRVSQRVLAVVSSYWRVRAADLDLEILRLTEASARNQLQTTRRLVAADLVPAADLVQLEADVISREASRIAGEQALYASVRELGREIGLEPAEIDALGVAADPFPTVDPEAVLPPAAALVRLALEWRADLRADRERLVAAGIRLDATEDLLSPRLDLVLTPSYSGLVRGDDVGDYFSPLGSNVPGLSTTFGLSFSWPLRNRLATGNLIRSRAASRRQDLTVELATKAIGADVPVALDAVRKSLDRQGRLERAVELFARALENEEKKLRAGSSTLIDVISQRDRLASAQQRLIGAQRSLAIALADLRFQTGTLVVDGAGDGAAVRRDDLTTLPD